MAEIEFAHNFVEVVNLIKRSRSQALRVVNAELIDLYSQIGEYISRRLASEDWGKSVVVQLADHLQKTEPGLKGFSSQNLWRMRQFYESYVSTPKLSSLLRENSWTNNLTIMTRCKTFEEKEFYLALAADEKLTSRELERQIDSGNFERTMLGNLKLSAVLREVHPNADSVFKDQYVFEFLDLPEPHSEVDLQRALIERLKKFLLELGRDFLFVGQEFRIQVGNTDFYLDLLFFHRGLQCLIDFELKVAKFKPEFLGKLNFYLEALDRDVKKEHENPSIGVLLCKGKDDTVVEYALSRSLSPAVVAEYEIKLPDKKLLEAKLVEFIGLYAEEQSG